MTPHAEPAPEVYRHMVDLAPDAMLAVDADTGQILLANARVEHLFGHTHEELIGHPVEMLVPERLRGSHRSHRAAYADDAEPRSMGKSGSELVARHRDGHEFPVEVWLTPLAPHSAGLVVVAVRDISERRAIEDASERMRDELIATVSHELRTPLTSILGYTEILADLGEDGLSEHAARLLDVVRRNAHRELKLVEDMLVLASLSTSSLMVTPRPLDLGTVVQAVLTDLAGHAEQAEVELASGGEETLWVEGDVHGVHQVLCNLVRNAIKFTEPGGRVEVRLLAEESHRVLEVEDQGTGVADHELPRIFDRLYRPHDVVAAHVPGAGLGLPVVKGIIDAHDGEVELRSEVGEGTSVQVRLPLTASVLTG